MEAKAAEAALDQAVPDFPKAALKKHYVTARADAASAQPVEEEAAALTKIQEMKAEREMLSPKSKKNFDEKHTDD